MKGLHVDLVFGVGLSLAAVGSGCGVGAMMGGLTGRSLEPTGLAAEVAEKTRTIGAQIGGEGGFGGVVLDDYLPHMEDHMGFHGVEDSADADGQFIVVLVNESGEDGTFRMV